jgi:hypothetical protein
MEVFEDCFQLRALVLAVLNLYDTLSHSQLNSALRLLSLPTCTVNVPSITSVKLILCHSRTCQFPRIICITLYYDKALVALQRTNKGMK